ncbi:hypothetical protein [Microbacterium sp. 77mftsu3.1]|uniref:hypothetical protein n=1 Tax=Microbacterium sp. 77mftsu3.1 TaxID=1761802 RepID=UPI000363A35E|nr:hypothetical protein [Microbacterium sp. 77mftsu3.1]SDH42705.1 hypothetical protein SAMN04488590_3314 [Microbacterium sp. 77mftsu3.1]
MKLSDPTGWRRDLAELQSVFDAAAAERDQRPDFDGREPGWVLYERAQMHDAVNRLRARLGKPPVATEAIEGAERSACGHVDYAQKFALGAADLVHAP